MSRGISYGYRMDIATKNLYRKKLTCYSPKPNKKIFIPLKLDACIPKIRDGSQNLLETHKGFTKQEKRKLISIIQFYLHLSNYNTLMTK